MFDVVQESEGEEMTPEERAAKIEFNTEAGSVNLLGGWSLDEDDARRRIAGAIREAVAANRGEFIEQAGRLQRFRVSEAVAAERARCQRVVLSYKGMAIEDLLDHVADDIDSGREPS